MGGRVGLGVGLIVQPNLGSTAAPRKRYEGFRNCHALRSKHNLRDVRLATSTILLHARSLPQCCRHYD